MGVTTNVNTTASQSTNLPASQYITLDFALPTAAVVDLAGTGFAIRHDPPTRRRPALTGIIYTSEVSTSLTGWEPFIPNSEIPDDGDPLETITVTLPAVLLDQSELFLRVNATSP